MTTLFNDMSPNISREQQRKNRENTTYGCLLLAGIFGICLLYGANKMFHNNAKFAGEISHFGIVFDANNTRSSVKIFGHIPKIPYALIPSVEEVDPLRMRKILTNQNAQHFDILIPDASKKLALCRNPKAMIAVMTTVWAYVKYGDVCSPTMGWTKSYMKKECHWWSKYHTVAPIPSKATDPETHYMAIVRDPLSRFISGFVDKCHLTREPCFGCRTDFPCFVRRLHEFLQRAAMKVALARAPGPQGMRGQDEQGNAGGVFNGRDHFFPQNWMCDLRRGFRDKEDMSVLTYARSDAFYDQLLGVLRRWGGVDETKLGVISAGLRTKTTKHDTTTNPAVAKANADIAGSAELCQLFYASYASDYELLGFPLPDCLANTNH